MKGELTMNEVPTQQDADESVDAQVFSPTASVTIFAKLKWQSAKLLLAKGDKVRVAAYGNWKMNPQHTHTYGPDGCEFTAGSGYILPGYPAGCLCARIGNGTPFLIGSERDFVADSHGDLQFITNDHFTAGAPGGFHDNTGYVCVIITVKHG
jgi:hypothetical protein